MWYVRITQTERGRFLPERRWHESTRWESLNYKSYAREGDAKRAITSFLKYREGRYWTPDTEKLSMDEQAALQAWKDEHAALIEAETQSTEDEEARKRAEFQRYLVSIGAYSDDMGAEQAALLDA